MFDIRETRLRNDYNHVRELVNRSEFIEIVQTESDPPDKYLIRFTYQSRQTHPEA